MSPGILISGKANHPTDLGRRACPPGRPGDRRRITPYVVEAGTNYARASPLISLRDMEVRSQDSEARMADAYALSKRLTSSSEVVRLLAASVAVSQVFRQNQVIATLLQRSLGHIHVSRLVRFATPTKSFSDVGRNRDCCSSHL